MRNIPCLILRLAARNRFNPIDLMAFYWLGYLVKAEEFTTGALLWSLALAVSIAVETADRVWRAK